MARVSRDYSCPVKWCEEKFFSKEDLNEHQNYKVHHICLICKEKFPIAFYLNEHKASRLNCHFRERNGIHKYSS
jgi:hypothetical protein